MFGCACLFAMGAAFFPRLALFFVWLFTPLVNRAFHNTFIWPLLVVNLTSGSNPVLAHKFIDYLLDVHNAVENYSYVGYMQPLTTVTPVAARSRPSARAISRP